MAPLDPSTRLGLGALDFETREIQDAEPWPGAAVEAQRARSGEAATSFEAIGELRVLGCATYSGLSLRIPLRRASS